MTPPAIETEAKFVIPDRATFTALQQITRLDGFELRSIGPKTVVDRYLDTADRRLLRAGFACRVRQSGGKQILTLKSLTPAEGEIHRRREIEAEVETDQPQAWAGAEAGNLALAIAGPAPLETLFVLYQTRHQFQVRLQGQPVIELSLDEVSLHEGSTVDYLELEAELMEGGTEADLNHFIDTLQRRWSLKVETQSKFERALASIN